MCETLFPDGRQPGSPVSEVLAVLVRLEPVPAGALQVLEQAHAVAGAQGGVAVPAAGGVAVGLRLRGGGGGQGDGQSQQDGLAGSHGEKKLQGAVPSRVKASVARYGLFCSQFG